jgi:hypothetical protein
VLVSCQMSCKLIWAALWQEESSSDVVLMSPLTKPPTISEAGADDSLSNADI